MWRYMSKQRDILPKILSLVLQQAPDAAVFLSGSVSFGHERPESDLDIMVVVPNLDSACFPGGKVTSQTQYAKVTDTTFEGVRLDLVFLTPSFLEEELVHRPWRGYYFVQLEIVHDPEGMIQSYQSRIASWFDDRPDIVEVWKEWMTQRKARAVSGGKQQGELIRNFPDIFALWKYLDPLVTEQANGEPRDGDNGS